MTPAEFRAIRKTISARQTIVGQMLGVSDDTISRIERGDMGDTVPTVYALAIERLAQIANA